MEMPGRTIDTEAYRYGFNGKEKDSDFEDNYDFGARIYDSRIGRWLSTDPKQNYYTSYSSYHFAYCNPIAVIDPDGAENIVIVGNQSDGQTQTPNSDVKWIRSKGSKQRHFLERGLKEARRVKKDRTVNDETTTMLVYKGNYAKEELDYYRKVAEKDGINIVEVTKSSEIVTYINETGGFNGGHIDGIASGRGQDLITDFIYVGHGEPRIFWTGYNYDKDDYFQPGELKTEAFDIDTEVLLYGCGQGVESNSRKLGNTTKYTSVFDDFKNRLTRGKITGYRVTVNWQDSMGNFVPHDEDYYHPNDREGAMRQKVPEAKRKRVEQGQRKPRFQDPGLVNGEKKK